MISNTVHELTGYLKAFFQLAVLILGYNINLSPEKKFANMFYNSVGLKNIIYCVLEAEQFLMLATCAVCCYV